MKKFIVKHAVGIIGIILIVAIFTLSVALIKAPETPLAAEDIEDTSAPAVSPDPPVEQPPTVEYLPSFPKASVASEKYIYTQNIRGLGNIKLCNLHRTVNGLYCVAASDCTVGDIASGKPCVGVTKNDGLGNTESALTLPATVATYYVASQITPIGLVVITANAGKTYLYVNTVSYDLKEVKTNLISYADAAKIFPTEDGYVIFTDYADESLAYTYRDGQLVFESLPACDIVEIFEYNDRFSVVFNTASGYSVCEMDKGTLRVLETFSVPSARLYDIIPVRDGEETVFIAIEYDGALYAKKYDKNFRQIGERKKTGAYQAVGVGTDGERVYLAVKGNVNGIITLNTDLTSVFDVNDASFLTAKIYDKTYLNGEFLMLAGDGENLALITVGKSSHSVKNLEKTTGAAYFAVEPNGTLAIAYDGKFHDWSCVELIGLQ